jgi:hypothetical protein
VQIQTLKEKQQQAGTAQEKIYTKSSRRLGTENTGSAE